MHVDDVAGNSVGLEHALAVRVVWVGRDVVGLVVWVYLTRVIHVD